jgi:hypothetical protein
MPWEALAGTIERFEGPIPRPIDLAIVGQRAHIRIPGAILLETTPLNSPVTRNVVTTRTMRVEHETLRMEWPAKYASTSEVTWTNGA